MKLRVGLPEQKVDISYLKDRLDYESVLELMGIEVSKQVGEWIMCHCPNTVNHANGDTNPSFGFNPDTMSYNCFVCGGGSLLDLVKEQMGMTDEQAETWLREQSSFEPSKPSTLLAQVEKIMHSPRVQDIMPEYPEVALDKFLHLPMNFLEERGISPEVAQQMKIGYDTSHPGVVIPHYWDGKLRGWQLRHVVHDGVPICSICKKPPKYTNTINFPKLTTLYNYDNVDDSLVIVVESPLSVLKLKTYGWNNVLATFGSFSEEQAELLRKFATVFYWPDNDSAGLKNTRKAIKGLHLYTQLFIVPVVDNPGGDPADLPFEGVVEHLGFAKSWSLFRDQLFTLEEARANIK